MSDGLLLPPNIERLSSSVIGVVMARNPAPPSYVFDAATPRAPNKTSPPSQQSAPSKEQCPGTRSSSHIAASVEHTKQSTTQLKPAPPSDQLRDDLWHKLSTAEKIRKLMMHRRRRCRTQRQYREKMKDKEAFLAKEVDRMRDEIQHLERMKFLASKEDLTGTSPLRLVAEYFNLFRHGLDVQDLDGSTPLRLDKDHAQKRYLQRVMASDVASNRGFGVQALLVDWRSLSLRHDKLELALAKLDYGVKDVVVADAKIYTTKSQNACSTRYLLV
ncbi:hypothetical protein PR003_g11661 [Phytophthora rubi]|uniref:BZIP domain-containing protein n=2 Tax=Phytophthora rubi TaxID=129364 RepID=A0A6A4FA67_9STRA|nr:hypothetical protein PR003_g11661 [Phytophthora rubi]